MNNKIKLTKKQAREFILAHQGLLPPHNLEGKTGIMNYISRVGCIQFDPLNKVGRNPDLVLQSRIKNYRSELLRELLYDDRKLIDGWDKNMSIYPVADWPYFSRYRRRARKKYSKKKGVQKILPEVRKALKERGPLSSIDLEFDKKVDWAWAPTRAARATLESMYKWGELIIHHKVGTRKVYDFADNHLSNQILTASDPNMNEKQYYSWHVKRRIGSVGMLWGLSSSNAWLGIRGLNKKKLTAALSRLLKQDRIIKVEIEGIKHSLYIRKEEEHLIHNVLENKYDTGTGEVAIIAPLDNLLWDRKLIKRIFDFEYVWEVYKPVAERKYGYYVLPVLYGDRFVGRFEPVLDREKNELIIKNWWWESDICISKNLKKKFDNCFNQFMNYLEASKIDTTRPMNFRKG